MKSRALAVRWVGRPPDLRTSKRLEAIGTILRRPGNPARRNPTPRRMQKNGNLHGLRDRPGVIETN